MLCEVSSWAHARGLHSSVAAQGQSATPGGAAVAAATLPLARGLTVAAAGGYRDLGDLRWVAAGRRRTPVPATGMRLLPLLRRATPAPASSPADACTPSRSRWRTCWMPGTGSLRARSRSSPGAPGEISVSGIACSSDQERVRALAGPAAFLAVASCPGTGLRL